MLCVLVLLVFFGAFVAEKVDSVHTYCFVQMVVLLKVQVVLEVLEVNTCFIQYQICIYI